MTTETTFAAHLLEGMGEDMEEPAPMIDSFTEQQTRPSAAADPLPSGRIDPELRARRYATADEMADAGWQLDYTLDGYGRLFGRWPEGADPVALIPVREAA